MRYFAWSLVAVLAAGGAVRPTDAPPGERVERTDIFEAGKDGYALYRIPGIVATSNGTVLAYCEARKSDRGDWGPIDILLRRSTDHGRTWEPRQSIAHAGEKVPKNPAALKQKLAAEGTPPTANNPVLIADKKPGVVHFLYCVEYSRCFYSRSTDDGKSFSKPRDITGALEPLRKTYDWLVVASGPAHGVQLKSGRLVVPVWLSLGTGGHAHRPSVVTTLVSGDGGDTWAAGDVAVPNTPEVVNPNETAVAELSDGTVVLNTRSESKANRRVVVTSPDGATKWTEPKFQEELVEPVCMASLVRVPGTGKELLFANPDNLTAAKGTAKPGQGRDRKNLTVRYSPDDGATWPKKRVLEPGTSGYSDLAVAADGTVLCFYERASTAGGNHYQNGALCVARFPLAWVKDAPADPAK
jgi:sialidase-1